MQDNNRRKPSSSGEPTGEDASPAIYLRAVIDVPGVLTDHPDASRDAVTATSVTFNSAQIIVTTTAGTVDQSSGAITINADAGDTVRFFAVSGSNNFEDAVLVQSIGEAAEGTVVEDAALLMLPQTAVAPSSNAGELTAAPTERNFWFWQFDVAGEGTQAFSPVFALYDRDEEGQPRFAGLYRWDLQLTVLSSPPPDENTQNQERTP